MRILCDLLVEARAAGTVRPILDYLYAALARDMPATMRRPACKPGCGWCCHTRVPATAPELLYLAGYGADPLGAQIKLAIRSGAQARRHDPAYPASLVIRPCALLDDAHCAAHPQRPMVCRTAISYDWMACRMALADPENAIIPSDINAVGLRAAFDIALHGALLHAGYAATRYELVTGLGDIIEHPDPEAAWLRGEDLFASALRIEEDDFFSSPLKRAFYEAAFGGGGVPH